MNNKLGYVTAAVVILGVVLFGVGVIVQQNHSSADIPCVEAPGAKHQVVILNDKASPGQSTGKRCDTLTITNQDNVTREVAFGPHEGHVAYDGVTEKQLRKGESLTVTLDTAGKFRFHDHLHDEVEGFFTVTK